MPMTLPSSSGLLSTALDWARANHARVVRLAGQEQQRLLYELTLRV
jgi:hypothetical protein